MRNPSRRFGRALHRARNRHEIRMTFDNWVCSNVHSELIKAVGNHVILMAKALEGFGKALRPLRIT